jgi:hypothetical protein
MAVLNVKDGVLKGGGVFVIVETEMEMEDVVMNPAHSFLCAAVALPWNLQKSLTIATFTTFTFENLRIHYITLR